MVREPEGEGRPEEVEVKPGAGGGSVEPGDKPRPGAVSSSGAGEHAEFAAGGRRAGTAESRRILPADVPPEKSGAHVDADEEYYNLPRAHYPDGNGNPHGKMSSWIVVVTAFVALVVGAIAFILHAWVLMWVCAVIAVLCFPAAMIVHVMDDTVSWGAPTPGSMPRGQIIRGANRIHDRDQNDYREAHPGERQHVRQQR